ncbi:putative phage protein [Escherichia coli 1-110-08_S4_C1]|nr:putative phage protein [Escherichia coli 1-110-08_S4_C1]
MNLSQDGIKLHRGNFTAIGRHRSPREYLRQRACNGLSDNRCLEIWREKRSLSQNALSHMWYSEISEYLISRGKTFATPAWVKDALKHTYLGYETKDLVDVVTGDITTIQSLRHTSDLDTGEMYVFLCKVEAWAMNIGCHLTIPQSCEFQLLRDKQEA